MTSIFRNKYYLKQAAILSLGTLVAQLIPIAVSPLLTRMYGSEDFGFFATYMACAAIASVVVTGRYELAITLPAEEKQAANLLLLTLKLSSLLSLTMAVPMVLFRDSLSDVFEHENWAFLLPSLPVTVFSLATFNTFQLWCNRQSRFKRMAANKIQNSLALASGKIACGLWQLPGGMTLGTVIGQIISTTSLIIVVIRESWPLFRQGSSEEQRALAVKYAAHPKYLVPSHLIGAIAVQMPLFMISSLYSVSAAGFFSLAYGVICAPTGLIANSIGDVYRQKIAVDYNKNGNFRSLFVKTIAATAAVAWIPFVIIYFNISAIFSIIFGADWSTAGEYGRILLIAAFLQFVCTPVDKGALVVGATRYIFWWHALRFALLSILYVALLVRPMPIEAFLWFFTGISSCLYLADAAVGFSFSGGRQRDK